MTHRPTDVRGIDLNLCVLIQSVAKAHPNRPAIIHGGHATSFHEFADRSHRLASLLAANGFGCHTERDRLRGHESGQSLMGQYLYNSTEYLEGMVGAFGARVAPFNINYRYVADELAYLLRDAKPQIIQYHARLASTLQQALLMTGLTPLLLQVADDSGHELLPGSLDYASAVATTDPRQLPDSSPDDLYVLYTGGTTGMPKGVLWRQADIAVTAMGLTNHRQHREWASLGEALDAAKREPARLLLCAPLIHGASQWAAFQALGRGGAVVFPNDARAFGPHDVWDTACRERVTQICIVGEAFARPLADEIERRPRELPFLRYLVSGGAAFRAATKARLTAAIPSLSVIETIGSSETGVQGHSTASGPADTQNRHFAPDNRTLVISEDGTHFLEPGHEGSGWLASADRIPLGYLGDRAKTVKSYPVIEDIRLSVPGDRARLLADGAINLLGRDSVTINSGGEKIFVEEVEEAVRAHPEVLDAVVCGRPSQRWGSEVVAIVSVRNEHPGIEQAILSTCSTKVARYKVPKAVVVVERIERSPAGKPDYRWAVNVATKAQVE